MDNYLYQQNGKTYGPVTLQALEDLWQHGLVNPDTPVQSQPGEDWAPLSKVLEKSRPHEKTSETPPPPTDFQPPPPEPDQALSCDPHTPSAETVAPLPASPTSLRIRAFSAWILAVLGMAALAFFLTHLLLNTLATEEEQPTGTEIRWDPESQDQLRLWEQTARLLDSLSEASSLREDLVLDRLRQLEAAIIRSHQRFEDPEIHSFYETLQEEVLLFQQQYDEYQTLRRDLREAPPEEQFDLRLQIEKLSEKLREHENAFARHQQFPQDKISSHR